MPLTRSDFHQLADVRAAEAAALLAAGLWDGAYYLAGYAVECALKARIMWHVEQTGIIFEDKKFAERCWTHDLKLLLELANLTTEWKAEIAAQPGFLARWDVAVKWDEAKRYARIPEADARLMVAAVTDPTDGVLPWIRRHW